MGVFNWIIEGCAHLKLSILFNNFESFKKVKKSCDFRKFENIWIDYVLKSVKCEAVFVLIQHPPSSIPISPSKKIVHDKHDSPAQDVLTL